MTRIWPCPLPLDPPAPSGRWGAHPRCPRRPGCEEGQQPPQPGWWTQPGLLQAPKSYVALKDWFQGHLLLQGALPQAPVRACARSLVPFCSPCVGRAKSPCIHSYSFIFLFVQQISPELLISIRQPADSGYRVPILLSLQSSRGYTGRETSLNTRPECSGFGDSHSMLLWGPGT